jgi:hypothetical protein
MSKNTSTLVLTSLCSLLVACTSSQTTTTTQVTVTDTLGLRFNVDCSSGVCALAPQNSAITPQACGSSGGNDVFVLVFDPLLAIYAMHVPASGSLDLNAADPSHPVACASDADCLAPGVTIGAVTNSYSCQGGVCLLKESCLNGSCTLWDGKLLTYDVLTLCQADLPWPSSCPYITSQPYASRIAAVADLCGSTPTCTAVPAACRPTTTAVDGGSPATASDGGGAGPALDGGLPGTGIDAGS